MYKEELELYANTYFIYHFLFLNIYFYICILWFFYIDNYNKKCLVLLYFFLSLDHKMFNSYGHVLLKLY